MSKAARRAETKSRPKLYSKRAGIFSLWRSGLTLTVKVSWDPDAMVWYTAYSDLPGLNFEADTIDELRHKLAGAIEDLTGQRFHLSLASCTRRSNATGAASSKEKGPNNRRVVRPR
jgi:hypothetical protein